MEPQRTVLQPAPLAEAQDELARSLAEEGKYTLCRATADGSCFFEALRLRPKWPKSREATAMFDGIRIAHPQIARFEEVSSLVICDHTP